MLLEHFCYKSMYFLDTRIKKRVKYTMYNESDKKIFWCYKEINLW